MMLIKWVHTKLEHMREERRFWRRVNTTENLSDEDSARLMKALSLPKIPCDDCYITDSMMKWVYAQEAQKQQSDGTHSGISH